MSLADLVEQVLCEGYCEVCDTRRYELKESGKQAKTKRIVIKGNRDEMVVMKPDKEQKGDSVFKSGNGQLKRCDYVLFVQQDGAKYKVLIEMKSSSYDIDEVKRKFNGTMCKLDHIDSVLRKLYNCDENISNYSERYVLFYHIPLGKTTTTLRKPSRNDRPEKMLEINVNNGDNISVRELIM